MTRLHSFIELYAPTLEAAGDFTISQDLLEATLAAGGMLDNDVNKGLWLGASSRPERHAAARFPRLALEVTTFAQTTIQETVAACRHHGARLTGLFNHLAARAIIKTLQSRGHEYLKVCISGPSSIAELGC